MSRLPLRAVVTATVLVLAAHSVEAARSPVLASGLSALLTDKSSYKHGDQIRICWLIPAAGTSKVTDTDPQGGSQVLRSGPDSGSGCISGTLGGPLLGRECMTLDFDTPRGSGSLQRCFMIGDAATEEHVVADHPQLTLGDVSGPGDTDIAIDGAGFQTFSYAAHGVTLFVLGPDGSQVDSDELFPSADGTLHVVLHSANYAPGEDVAALHWLTRVCPYVGRSRGHTGGPPARTARLRSKSRTKLAPECHDGCTELLPQAERVVHLPHPRDQAPNAYAALQC